MMDRRSFVVGTTALVAAGPLFAQETFPSHAITIINAFPPGGINDIVTRPLANMMEPILKQPVVVETKAGAAGQVGAQVVASAKPDGYTLLSHNTGISGYAEVDKLFGRPVKTSRSDFIPLARIVADPVVLLVNDQQPYKTVKEFIEDVKKQPDTLVFSSGGLYGATHLPLALLDKAAGGVKVRHLPTNGGGPAITAILGNNAQVHDPIGFRDASAHQGRQAAAAGRIQCDTLEGVARCPDAQGARLRHRILSVGWYLRAEGNAGADRADLARRHQEGSAFRPVQDVARERGPGARLSRRSRFPEILGHRRQAH
jgi:hypothetical protein